MRLKKARWCFTWTAVVLVLGMLAGTSTYGAGPSVPEGWTFVFPDGNATAGQTVFLKMECHSCHVTTIPGVWLPADTGGQGPSLVGYSALPKEYLAESIIKAHTVVAVPGYEVKEGKAGMGNYNHFMTIQELIDIVAFLKANPSKAETP